MLGILQHECFSFFLATISSKDIATNMEVECKVDLLFIQFLFALLLYIFASLNLFAEEAELPPLLFIILLWKTRLLLTNQFLFKMHISYPTSIAKLFCSPIFLRNIQVLAIVSCYFAINDSLVWEIAGFGFKDQTKWFPNFDSSM